MLETITSYSLENMKLETTWRWPSTLNPNEKGSFTGKGSRKRERVRESGLLGPPWDSSHYLEPAAFPFGASISSLVTRGSLCRPPSFREVMSLNSLACL